MDERFSDGIIILHTRMSFFEAVVDIDTHCTRRVDILYLDQMKITYQLLALQLDRNRGDRRDM